MVNSYCSSSQGTRKKDCIHSSIWRGCLVILLTKFFVFIFSLGGFPPLSFLSLFRDLQAWINPLMHQIQKPAQRPFVNYKFVYYTNTKVFFLSKGVTTILNWADHSLELRSTNHVQLWTPDKYESEHGQSTKDGQENVVTSYDSWSRPELLYQHSTDA